VIAPSTRGPLEIEVAPIPGRGPEATGKLLFCARERCQLVVPGRESGREKSLQPAGVE